MSSVISYKTTSKLSKNQGDCPIPLEVIPNNMGISLEHVKGISWEKTKDGQLISVTIDFIPGNQKVIKEEKTNILINNITPVSFNK